MLSRTRRRGRAGRRVVLPHPLGPGGRGPCPAAPRAGQGATSCGADRSWRASGAEAVPYWPDPCVRDRAESATPASRTARRLRRGPRRGWAGGRAVPSATVGAGGGPHVAGGLRREGRRPLHGDELRRRAAGPSRGPSRGAGRPGRAPAARAPRGGRPCAYGSGTTRGSAVRVRLGHREGGDRPARGDPGRRPPGATRSGAAGRRCGHHGAAGHERQTPHEGGEFDRNPLREGSERRAALARDVQGSDNGSASPWRHGEFTRSANAVRCAAPARRSGSQGPPQRGHCQVSPETGDRTPHP